jgi:hypothetical protein
MYRRVLSGWQGADASFDARRADLLTRLNALTARNQRSTMLVRN